MLSSSASSSLVNVSEDAEVRLVSMLAEALNNDQKQRSQFQAACQQCIDAGQAEPLLETILKQYPQSLRALYSSKEPEAVAACTLLAALVDKTSSSSSSSNNKAEQQQRQQAAVQELSDAIVAQAQQSSDDDKERTIVLLSVLYNLQTNAAIRCALLQQMFQLAPKHLLATPDQILGKLLVEEDDTNNGGTAVTAVSATGTASSKPRLVSLLDGWNTDDATRRKLYKTIVKALEEQEQDDDDDNDKRKQRFLLLLVESYNNKDDDTIDEQGLQAAKEAAIGAIRDPFSLFVHQRNLLSMPAVQALAKDHASLLGLLKVFQQGKLTDYETFCNEHGGELAVLKALGLKAEACTRNMRILSLVSLASEHEEIPYSEIAKTLQLPAAASGDIEVEAWVIAAVSSGLLQAKIDQLAHKVMVERSVVRRFDMEQWKALQSRLQLWKKNVSGVLESLRESSTSNSLGAGGGAASSAAAAAIKQN